MVQCFNFKLLAYQPWASEYKLTCDGVGQGCFDGQVFSNILYTCLLGCASSEYVSVVDCSLMFVSPLWKCWPVAAICPTILHNSSMFSYPDDASKQVRRFAQTLLI